MFHSFYLQQQKQYTDSLIFADLQYCFFLNRYQSNKSYYPTEYVLTKKTKLQNQ